MWSVKLQIVFCLFIYDHKVAFYANLPMNHYGSYFSNVFYQLVRLPTVIHGPWFYPDLTLASVRNKTGNLQGPKNILNLFLSPTHSRLRKYVFDQTRNGIERLKRLHSRLCSDLNSMSQVYGVHTRIFVLREHMEINAKILE